MDCRRACALLLAAVLSAACAAPQVKLYPDERLKSIPKETVDKDIKECDDRAKEFVKANKGKIVAKHAGAGAVFGAFLGMVAGAFTGNFGRAIGEGAAIGAAAGLAGGAVHANSPEGVHRRFVEYCLTEKGYKPIGWK
ncbi:MAG: cell envelope biogenesis protein OmpA [Elusimicrobia bacterium]|nr:cell envelope biogenesis protein OmpA [Elusimicrobiota bacterium]